MKVLLFLAGLAACSAGLYLGLLDMGENWETGSSTDKSSYGCLIFVGGAAALIGSIVWALV